MALHFPLFSTARAPREGSHKGNLPFVPTDVRSSQHRSGSPPRWSPPCGRRLLRRAARRSEALARKRRRTFCSALHRSTARTRYARLPGGIHQESAVTPTVCHGLSTCSRRFLLVTQQTPIGSGFGASTTAGEIIRGCELPRYNHHRHRQRFQHRSGNHASAAVRRLYWPRATGNLKRFVEPS